MVSKTRSCSIVIGGDIYPGNLESQFLDRRVSDVFGGLLDTLKSSDTTVVNLECPLTDRGHPIRKLGPHFRAAPGVAWGLKAAGIDAVTLANNHIRDYGEAGVEQTINVLGDVGLHSFGAGRGSEEAAEPAVFELNGVRVAFVGMAEHEFSIAGPDSWGANPIDLIRFAATMQQLRESPQSWDHLIILLHAGNEFFPYPNPWQQRLSRFLIDQGASAVISQHSHVAGTYEKYNGGLIVYGQGDFIFGTPGSLRPARKDGFLIKLELGCANRPLGHSLIPFTRHEAGIRKMDADEESGFRRAIEERNKVLASAELLEEQWRQFVESRRHALLSRVQGQPRLLRGIIRRLGLERWWYNRYDPGPPLNYIQCESHRQVLTALLDSMLTGGN